MWGLITVVLLLKVGEDQFKTEKTVYEDIP